MAQLISDQTIDLLDRKYRALTESPRDIFMLDLVEFHKFLTEDYLVRDYTEKVRRDFVDAFLRFDETSARK